MCLKLEIEGKIFNVVIGYVQGIRQPLNVPLSAIITP